MEPRSQLYCSGSDRRERPELLGFWGPAERVALGVREHCLERVREHCLEQISGLGVL